MEDELKKLRPNDARYFSQFLENARNVAKTDRDKWWWAWVFQFGRELSESLSSKEVTEEEAETVKKKVASFMEEETNKEDFIETMERTGEKYDFWWEDTSET